MNKLYIDIFEELKGVKAFFSTKHGASEGSPYNNREAIEAAGLGEMQPVWLNQVHKADIAVVTEKGDEPVLFPETDGVITDVAGVMLTTVHADCIPVWFYDEEHHAIGLVHAGWRGTQAGIGPAAVKKMQETYGTDPAKVRAYIGPGISKCCFETGPEVIEAFREKWDFADQCAEPKGDKYYIDLKEINKRELLQAGVAEANIGISSHCTCCQPETFASYRREGGTYMRMGAVICLTE